MDSFLAVLAAGSLIPGLAFIVKKLLIDTTFEKGISKEIKVSTSDGKYKFYIINKDTSAEEIRKIIESEMDFESLVKKSIIKYIDKHKSEQITLSEDGRIDFVLEKDGKKIAIEAKSDLHHFKPKWATNFNSEEFDNFIFIVNSSISDRYKEKISKRMKNNKKVKFLSITNDRFLKNSLEQILNSEFRAT